jgi:crotonobetainyl-CoA:carnitine CoA-transferase CaiB-like acyl-CoA transferase
MQQADGSQSTPRGADRLPLAGVRVLELGVWVAGPAAAALLADWGAAVIKLESPQGDPLRGMANPDMGRDVNPWFEMDNRGKRSVAVNLGHPAGRTIAERLLAQSDVFITNLRLPALAKLHMDPETLRAAYPRLIYCRVTGYGPRGADADRPAFDGGAFWTRAGFMATMQEPDGDPPMPRGGTGDHTTGMSAAGAVCAALYQRERTGAGSLVDVSLYRAGIYVMGWDIAGHLRGVRVAPQNGRRGASNVLNTLYRAGDGRWFYLTNLTADAHWPGFCRAIERPDLEHDPRFAGYRARRQHGAELIDLLDGIFRTRTRAEWGERFDRYDVWWASAQTVPEVTEDPQAVAANAWVTLPGRDGAPVRQPAGPADFDGANSGAAHVGPEHGEHTEAVLLELGYTWQEIAALKEQGAIP